MCPIDEPHDAQHEILVVIAVDIWVWCWLITQVYHEIQGHTQRRQGIVQLRYPVGHIGCIDLCSRSWKSVPSRQKFSQPLVSIALQIWHQHLQAGMVYQVVSMFFIVIWFHHVSQSPSVLMAAHR